MREPGRMPRNRWLVIGLLTLVLSATFSVNLILGLLLPDISSDLNLSPSQQGWLGSSSLIAILLLGVPVSSWCSRYRPWRVLGIASLSVAGFVFLQARVPTFAALLVGRVGVGFASTVSQAPRMLLVRQWSSQQQVLKTNGIMAGIADVSLGLALLITPFILVWTDAWEDTLYVWAVICLIIAVAWLVLGKERVTKDYRESVAAQSGSPLNVILRYRQIQVLGLGVGGYITTESAFSVFWPTLAQEQLEIPSVVIGVAFGMLFFTAAPAEVLTTVLPWLTRKRFTILAVCALVSTVAHLGLIFTGSVPVVLTLFVLVGASISFFPVMTTMVFHLPDIKPREVAVGVSFIYTLASLGSATGPLLVGFLQEATGDLRTALFVTVFFPLLLLAGSIYLRNRWSAAPRTAAG
ncbi:MAG: nitrate/nitrite transporter [Dehalococcoidia bacterium]